MIEKREYSAPEISREEIYRYLGTNDIDSVENRVEKCLEVILPQLSYKVCFAEYPVTVSQNTVDFGFTIEESRNLAKCLSGCESAVIFVATVGIGIDRLMSRYSAISPLDSLIVSAIGTERVEALCDEVFEEFRNRYENLGKIVCPRFSPGYGDLSLSMQRDIFNVMDVSRNIGVMLGENMIMSPIKSVSAIVGIRNGENNENSRLP